MAGLVLLLVASLSALQATDAPLTSGLVRSLELERRPGTFIQHLRLDAPDAAPDARPRALLRYVAGPDEAGGVRVELELQFLAENLRVIHTESANAEERRLVFREVLHQGGRTLFLAGAPERGYEGHELGVRQVVRLALAPGAELPLLCIESARLGLGTPLEAEILDPLASTGESLKLSTHQNGPRRTFEARRADGSLRWRVGFEGEALCEWRFQESGVSARAITQDEFERTQVEHESSVRAAREAAAEMARRPRVIAR